ncbi:MAG: DUF4019 domain-containing protein [Desulfomonilaceae bacterium]
MRKMSFLLVMCLLFSCSFAGAADNEKEAAAVRVAEQWLGLVDQGKYDESWKETSTVFRNAVTAAQWEQLVQTSRKPLGKLLTRKVGSKTYTTSLPGVPDGQYVVIEFETSFENKKAAIETVTSMLDKDGTWRVSGYYIK